MMNEETIQAAREAFKRDPETAAQALLGMSADEMFVQALKGCNQHAHKPGCPEASGQNSDSNTNPDIGPDGIDGNPQNVAYIKMRGADFEKGSRQAWMNHRGLSYQLDQMPDGSVYVMRDSYIDNKDKIREAVPNLKELERFGLKLSDGAHEKIKKYLATGKRLYIDTPIKPKQY